MNKEKMLRKELKQIVAQIHENLRAENMSLCRDGHSDIYYSGVRDGKIEAYSSILWELDPFYDLTEDHPKECFRPGCREFFFASKYNARTQKYHTLECRSRHYEKMRSEKTGIFSG